jgi:hypothetical protein
MAGAAVVAFWGQVQADLALLHLEHVWVGSSLGVVDAVALFFEQS